MAHPMESTATAAVATAVSVECRGGPLGVPPRAFNDHDELYLPRLYRRRLDRQKTDYRREA